MSDSDDSAMTPVHLFLLPHQDDEAPVFLEIERLTRAGEKLRIVYLTTGQRSHETSEVRNRESKRVLGLLGVPAEQIHFLGGELHIPDGRLPQHLDVAYQALEAYFGSTTPASIHMPAWEGGHHDHDAAHLLGVALAWHWQRLEQSFQFPYYHGFQLKGILFKVLDPLKSNGPTLTDTIPLGSRLRYIRLLTIYKSQIGSWVGLGPFFALHYLLQGTQVRQKVCVTRIMEKPHEGDMLYERRAFSDYKLFQTDTAAFAGQHLPPPPHNPTNSPGQ